MEDRQNLRPHITNVWKKGPRRNFDIKRDASAHVVWRITTVLLMVALTFDICNAIKPSGARSNAAVRAEQPKQLKREV